MTKKGFTYVKPLIIVTSLVAITAVIIPITISIVNSIEEDSRKDQLEIYAKEVEKAYLLMIDDNNYPTFENYGATITLTNQWLDENVEIGNVNINCKNVLEDGEDDSTTLSKVSISINTKQVSLTNCTVDGKEGYNYFNEKVVKYNN